MVDLTSYKRLSRVLVLLCAMIGATGVLAQTGPGGVGDATSNILWLSADNITGLADGNDITTWTDGSGNSNDLTQSDSSLNPIYKTNILNGLPAVRFNKSNGRIRRNNFTTFPTTAITEIYVNSNNEGANDGILSYASEADDNDFMLMGSRSLRIHKKEGTLHTLVSVSDGNFHIVNASWRSIDGSTEVWKDGFKEWTRSNWQVGDPITSGGNFAIAGDQDSIDGGYQANQAHFGDFTEVLIFNTYLNTAQHIIVNNYLASKYALSIANDKYSYDGSLQTDVAGIGREDASSQHVDAQSAGILAVNTPSSLDDGDYLLFGHDNGAINAWTSTEIPSAGNVVERLVREWRFDETGDVGTIKFTVDTALLPAETTPNTTYALLVDADGDFSNGAAVYEMNSPGNNSFYETAANIAIADGDYVAISITSHPMLITVNTALGLTVDIPLFGTVSGVTIDWGDGTTPTTGINTAGTNSHTYGSAGNYVIEIDGNFTGYGWEGATPTAANVAAITGVTQWNLVGGASTLISLRGAFRDHVNLITVPDTLLSTIVLLPKAFLGATSFNHDISGWDTSSVSDFSQMFNEAISFNQDIGGWNTATGVDFSKMFRKAMSFNQDLSSWDTASATDMLNMFKLARLSVDNYDRLITAWDSVQGTTLNNLNFHGGYSLFCEAIDPGVPDGNKDCASQIVRTTLADDATTITVTWSKPVFTNIDGTGALTVNDYVLAITAGSSGTPATLISTTPTSISQNGNSYTLGLDLSGTLQPDQVISVLPAQ